LIATELFGLFQYGLDHFKGAGGAHEKVDKPGASNIHFRHGGTFRQPLNQGFSQFSGRAAGGFRRHQRNIAGVVAVGFIFRVADLRGEGLVCGKNTFGLEACQ
jgi:hypothetical protein